MQAAPNQKPVKDPETTSSAGPQSGAGFHISNEPVVCSNERATLRNYPGAKGSPASRDADLLYVIARDPKSLFVYWDLNWTRLFAQAGLCARQVHLRIYREDGSIEGTREINPFRGYCYAEVASAGTGYYCELGCFNDDGWTSLVRSRKTATPQDRVSDDISAQFATLPLHLSFQRLLDIMRATKPEGATLARAIAEWQKRAHVIQTKVILQEWSRFIAAAASMNGNGATAAEISALLQTPSCAEPAAEELARWSELGEQFGGSNRDGASGSGFGGSSPA
jgi:hypothetical protein